MWVSGGAFKRGSWVSVTQVNKSIQKIRQSSVVNRQCQGFTLVELTAAAALLALLTSAAFISYAQTWKHWALRQDAQRFYLAARYARVLAIESQRPCVLMVVPEEKAYYIVQSVEGEEEIAVVSNMLHRSSKLDDSVSFDRFAAVQTGLTGDVSGITFRPDGSADAALVQLTNGERSFTIQISAATAQATLLSGATDSYELDQIDLDDM